MKYSFLFHTIYFFICKYPRSLRIDLKPFFGRKLHSNEHCRQTAECCRLQSRATVRAAEWPLAMDKPILPYLPGIGRGCFGTSWPSVVAWPAWAGKMGRAGLPGSDGSELRKRRPGPANGPGPDWLKSGRAREARRDERGAVGQRQNDDNLLVCTWVRLPRTSVRACVCFVTR